MPTMTITTTTSEANRVAAAVGKALALKDGNGAPRDATAAEVKTFFIGRMKQLIIDIEGRDLTAAAVAAVVIPAFDPT